MQDHAFWQSFAHDAPPAPWADAYPARVADGRVLMLPIRPLAGTRSAIASLILNQASFAVETALADLLAERLSTHRPDVIVGLPTLGLSLARRGRAHGPYPLRPARHVAPVLVRGLAFCPALVDHHGGCIAPSLRRPIASPPPAGAPRRPDRRCGVHGSLHGGRHRAARRVGRCSLRHRGSHAAVPPMGRCPAFARRGGARLTPTHSSAWRLGDRFGPERDDAFRRRMKDTVPPPPAAEYRNGGLVARGELRGGGPT